MAVFASVVKGFKLANQNWKMVMALFGFYLVMGLANLPIQNNLPKPGDLAVNIQPFWAVMALLMLGINFLAGIFIQGGLLDFIKENIKTGQASSNVFWRSGKKFYIKLLLFSLLVVALIFVLMIVVFMLGLLVSLLAKGDQTLLSVMFIVFISLGGLLGFIGSVFVIYTPFIIVDREEKLFSAINDSVNLAAKNYGWTLLLLIGVGVGAVGVSALLIILINYLFSNNTIVVQMFNIATNSLLAGYFSLFVVSSLMSYYLTISKPQEPKF